MPKPETEWNEVYTRREVRRKKQVEKKKKEEENKKNRVDGLKNAGEEVTASTDKESPDDSLTTSTTCFKLQDVSLLEGLPQSSYGIHYFIMIIMLQQLFKFDNKNLH